MQLYHTENWRYFLRKSLFPGTHRPIIKSIFFKLMCWILSSATLFLRNLNFLLKWGNIVMKTINSHSIYFCSVTPLLWDTMSETAGPLIRSYRYWPCPVPLRLGTWLSQSLSSNLHGDTRLRCLRVSFGCSHGRLFTHVSSCAASCVTWSAPK